MRKLALALVLAVSLAACKDKPSQSAAASPPAPSARARPAIRTPAPALPAPPPAAEPVREPSHVEQEFAAEPIDAAWASATEDTLRARVPGAQVTCHQTMCELVVSGDDAALHGPIDAMNTLSDLGASLLLTRQGATVRGYLRFVRRAAN